MLDHELADRGTDPLCSDFVWGASTSSYQIEGAVRADGRGPSVWDGFSHEPGRIANGDTGDVACDHYHRYREDVELLRKIGVSAYRFSVAWSRVMPGGRGVVNEAGLAFYDRLIDSLLEAGIDPWLCLYHWDLPQALQDQGGWLNRDLAGWYADYAALIAARFGDRVHHFATFNEPSVFTLFGYGFAWHPPGLVDPAALHRAIHHVNLAHGGGVDALRAHAPRARIGAIHNVQPSRPVTKSDGDTAAARLLDAYWNKAFPEPQLLGHYPAELLDFMAPIVQAGDLERIHRAVDWFGLTHYSPVYARADDKAPLRFAWADAPAGVRRSPIGWEEDPSAFRDVLTSLHKRYRLPIYVTENGAGSNEQASVTGEVNDRERIHYLQSYISAMRDAVKRGADVRGYFIWSLLDNFEWGAGYQNRFGIVHVDFASQKRTPKASARWYAGMIRSSAVRKVL